MGISALWYFSKRLNAIHLPHRSANTGRYHAFRQVLQNGTSACGRLGRSSAAEHPLWALSQQPT
jgi:hypothetical protein